MILKFFFLLIISLNLAILEGGMDMTSVNLFVQYNLCNMTYEISNLLQ